MRGKLYIITDVVTAVLSLLAVVLACFTVYSVMNYDREDRSIFGYHAFVVLSDSMSATDFSAGDLIIVREVEPSTLEEGDIISYISADGESSGEVVTHKIRSVTEDENGDIVFITYGTTTGVDDPESVTCGMVVGKYIAAVPGVGKVFLYLQNAAVY